MSLHLYSLSWLSLITKVCEHPQLLFWGGEKGNHVEMALQRGRYSKLVVRMQRWCWLPNGLKDWQRQVEKTRQSAGRNNIPGICYQFRRDALVTHIWKEGPNSLKTVLQSTNRSLPYQLPADCLHCEHRWIQWLSSTTAARRWEQPF